MEETMMNTLLDETLSKVRELVDTNTVVGQPIITPDNITVIPVSRVTVGFGTGGTTTAKGNTFTGGNGAGAKVEPIGFFVIKDGACRMISIAPPPLNTMDRIVEMVPDILDKIDSMRK